MEGILLACEKCGLPRLNDLVVSQRDGRPSYRRVDGDLAIMTERRPIFGFDWYAVVPPTPEEYRELLEKA